MSNTKLQIKDIIMNFSNENLNAEFSNKALEILDKMEEANEQILETSRTDIWAASILNIVLDMNGVFNKKHPMYMTKKDFSSKIGVSAGTIKNKAEAVKELLNIEENDSIVMITATNETTEELEVKENIDFDEPESEFEGSVVSNETDVEENHMIEEIEVEEDEDLLDDMSYDDFDYTNDVNDDYEM